MDAATSGGYDYPLNAGDNVGLLGIPGVTPAGIAGPTSAATVTVQFNNHNVAWTDPQAPTTTFAPGTAKFEANIAFLFTQAGVAGAGLNVTVTGQSIFGITLTGTV